jgi:hypothetical protein
MPLLYIKHYSRAMIRAHPDWLFVFGDNLMREGYGGQAKEARDEPNAIGFVTKRRPLWSEDAFFADTDIDEWNAAVKPAMRELWDYARVGRTIIWPLDGIGTNRAQLSRRAPEIADTLEQFRMALDHYANTRPYRENVK